MAEKEYIERGAFDRELQNLVREYNKNCESDKSAGAFEALHRLRLAPAADVAPVVHGEWIAVPSSDMSTGKAYKCSNCKKMRYGLRLPPYCQECGAKMDGGKNE